MSVVTQALLAAVAALVVALGIVGYVAHERGQQIAVLTANAAVLNASIATYQRTQESNLASLEAVRNVNAENRSAAEAAKKLADGALAAVTTANLALNKVTAENAALRRDAYANDAKLRAWGDQPLPDFIASRLRNSAALQPGGGNPNGDGVSGSVRIDRSVAH